MQCLLENKKNIHLISFFKLILCNIASRICIHFKYAFDTDISEVYWK